MAEFYPNSSSIEMNITELLKMYEVNFYKSNDSSWPFSARGGMYPLWFKSSLFQRALKFSLKTKTLSEDIAETKRMKTALK